MWARGVAHAIAFVSDIHARPSAFEHATGTALSRGMTTIIVVGDFWIYDAPKKQVKLERISTRVCHHAGIALHLSDYRFIDGNHGNSDYGPESRMVDTGM